MADLPPIAFRNWANAHNFYGDFADLDAATLGDVRTFFKTYYAPSNAVLVILGDVIPEEAMALAEKYFAQIPAGEPAPKADASEAGANRGAPWRGRGEIRHATAVAIGYRAPARRTPDWYAAALLDQVLHGGRAGRVYRRLVIEQQFAIEAGGGTGDFIELNGPFQIVTRIIYTPSVSNEKMLAAYDAVIEEIRQNGIGAAELEEIKVKFRSDYYSALEGGHGAAFPRFGLMHYLACFTLFDGDPT